MEERKLDILVLAGGESSEREVSLNSSKAAARTLAQRGNRVRIMDACDGRWLTEDMGNPGPGVSGADAKIPARTAADDLPGINLTRALLKARQDGVDVVFLGLHGGFGENGSIQALLDILGIPYTGSPMAASAIAMNKDISKRIMRTLGISTADWQTFDRNAGASPESAEVFLNKGVFGWPVIIKPVDSGSTVGLTLVERAGRLGDAITTAFGESDAIMAERYLSGREITMSVLDGQALPPVEIKPTHKLYDYTCKYTKGKSHYFCPADIDRTITEKLSHDAVLFYQTIGCRGYGRVDFIVGGDGNYICLELNTLPGMTELSLFPMAAKAAGIEFGSLLERLCHMALERR